MDADVIELDLSGVTSPDLDQERCTRAAFELRLMLGRGCVDFGKILEILETKAIRAA